MNDRKQIRTYCAEQCISFRSTKTRFGGLSNMAGGFPLQIGEVIIPSAEALYQACRFPHQPEVQSLIIEPKSPMTAKMISRRFVSRSRPDWTAVRVRIMRWVLRVKLATHWTIFGNLLLATGHLPIVEDSRHDDFWGALRNCNDTLIGVNVLGRLLMELREQLRSRERDSLRVVSPPKLSNFLFLGKPIGPMGPSTFGQGVLPEL